MASSESGAAPHRFNFAAVVSVGLLLIVWQVASFFLPEFIVPGLQLIVLEFVKMFEEGTLVSDSLLTLVRVMLGLIGGFIFGGALGVLMGLATAGRLDPAILSLLGPGFCGGLTTYSTFGYETLRLAEDGSRFLASVNIAISLLAGLGAAFIGFATASAL